MEPLEKGCEAFERSQAVQVAIDVFHVPSRVRSVRQRQIPDDVEDVLLIAAGEDAAVERAVMQTQRSRTVVSEAASFYIEQILLHPGASSYRILGGDRTSNPACLRRHMALLLRWLHPDLDRNGAREALATRVTRAWDDLKTVERRQAYDAALGVPTSARRAGSRHGSGAHAGGSIHSPAYGLVVQERMPAVGRGGLAARLAWLFGRRS